MEYTCGLMLKPTSSNLMYRRVSSGCYSSQGSRDPSEYRVVKRLQFEYLCGFPHVLESGFSQGAVTRGQPFSEYENTIFHHC